MINIFLFFPFLFSYSYQIACLHKCPNFKIDSSNSYQEKSYLDECSNDTHSTRCHGQIMIYYELREQKFISYSLGSSGHIIEKEIEELAIKNGFTFVIYFLFLVDSFETDELVLSIYVICQTDDHCALKYIKKLVNLYKRRVTPMHQLNPLIYDREKLSHLTCYNYETSQAEECLIDQYQTCIINKTGIFEQGCHSGMNKKVEYVFIITLLKKYSIIKLLELVVCNRDNCNIDSVSKEIDNIIYNYTLSGLNITLNNSNKLNFSFLFFCFESIINYFMHAS
jgi:hypothetical protein